MLYTIKKIVGFNQYMNICYINAVILFLIIFSLHLFIIYKDAYIGDEDAAALALQGKSIAQGEGLKSNVVWIHVNKYDHVNHPEDYWPPLQSYLIAVLYTIFGQSLFITKLPNVIIFGFLIFTVYLLGSRIFSKKVGILASVMCMFSSDLCLLSISCRNDIFYIFLATIALYFMAKFGNTNYQSKKYLIISGIVCGIAFLQRPVSFLLVGSFILWFLFRFFSSEYKTLSWPKLGKNIILVLMFVGSFLIIISPYIVRNIYVFKKPIPSLASNLSAIALNSSKDINNSRSIESDLSHYKEMRYVYYDHKPRINWKSFEEISSILKKGIHEFSLTFLAFKRSYIIQITLLFLTFLSFFYVREKASIYLKLFLAFLILNIVFLSLHVHYEQRYYLFLIPIVAIYSSHMFFDFDKQIFNRLSKNKMRVNRKVYWIFIALFLAFIFLLPNISFYANKLKFPSNMHETVVIGDWVKRNTDENSVVMVEKPLRLGYHSNRASVMLPMASFKKISDIIKLYGVTHLIISESDIERFERDPFYNRNEFAFWKIKKIMTKNIFAVRTK